MAENPRRELHAWFSFPHNSGTSVASTMYGTRESISGSEMILIILQGTSACRAVPVLLKVLLMELSVSARGWASCCHSSDVVVASDTR